MAAYPCEVSRCGAEALAMRCTFFPVGRGSFGALVLGRSHEKLLWGFDRAITPRVKAVDPVMWLNVANSNPARSSVLTELFPNNRNKHRWQDGVCTMMVPEF